MKRFIKISSLLLLVIIVVSSIFPNFVHASNAVESAYNQLPESQLGLANVLNIILISIGVVLILLGIAIYIRLTKM